MEELEAAGWKKAKAKKVNEIKEMDIRSIFNLLDVDRSGSVSRIVSNSEGNENYAYPMYLIGRKNGSQAFEKAVCYRKCK